ncbi:putative NmrA-like domain, NAD(P)-binding domain superfamily [Septoria linicola]|nr:putative NmrA-like domain, NAD(P)-binding domain superfamily [Septoria linicola]
MSAFVKKTPTSILIFEAAAHIGRPLAEFLTREAPDLRLRPATSSPSKKLPLQQAFPNAEVVEANYSDIASLETAVADIEGVFVITPPGHAEKDRMTNLVAALKQAGCVVHVIRFLGIFRELAPSQVPASLGPGSLPIGHPIAKRILDESGLPVTYLNSGASFMDNFWLQIRPVLAKKTLIWPEHRVPFIDPRDIAQVAGRLFLSSNAKHIGALHTMNNGHDWLCFEEVAGILSEVLSERIAYDGSYESFKRTFGPVMGPRVQLLWDSFKFEEPHEEVWALNNFMERILGRKPTTVREWLMEHRDQLLGIRKDAARESLRVG